LSMLSCRDVIWSQNGHPDIRIKHPDVRIDVIFLHWRCLIWRKHFFETFFKVFYFVFFLFNWMIHIKNLPLLILFLLYRIGLAVMNRFSACGTYDFKWNENEIRRRLSEFLN
jgi:hypothetical protein